MNNGYIDTHSQPLCSNSDVGRSYIDVDVSVNQWKVLVHVTMYSDWVSK